MIGKLKSIEANFCFDGTDKKDSYLFDPKQGGALNDVGSSKTNLIIILNDNEMSISKNVGGISNFLSKIRSRKFYKKSNNFIKKAVSKIPWLGDKIIKLVQDFFQ